MKGGKYAKTLAKIQVRGLFRIRDIRRNVLTKSYRGLYGDGMLVPIQMGTNMADGRKPRETSVSVFCYKSVNLFFEELINIQVILSLILLKLINNSLRKYKGN